MATSRVRDSRLATLLPWLQRLPFLPLTEEQIGAYLLGIVPTTAPLRGRDRDDARREGQRAMKPHLEAGDVIQIGFPVFTRHGSGTAARSRSVFSWRPAEAPARHFSDHATRRLHAYYALRSPHWEYGTHSYSEQDPRRMYQLRHDETGLVDEGRIVDWSFTAKKKMFVASGGAKTWAYASPAFKTTPYFWDAYIGRAPLDSQGELFATKLLAHQLERGEGWYSDEILDSMMKKHSNILLFVCQVTEFGDCLISLLRAAELDPSVLDALSKWYPFLTWMNGVYLPDVDAGPWDPDSRHGRHRPLSFLKLVHGNVSEYTAFECLDSSEQVARLVITIAKEAKGLAIFAKPSWYQRPLADLAPEFFHFDGSGGWIFLGANKFP